MPDPDLITRIDRAIAELQAIRAEVVASMPHGMPRSDSGEAVGEVSGRDGLDADSDFRPESLIEHSGGARFNRPADSLRWACRKQACGVNIAARWMVSAPRLARYLNGK